ncbi:MAG: 2-C-methyl-D-erythritol 4-phosphate cytidylyltransferase [Acutalibacteraceae bacterium]|nr:2-C-methyl-D-erythritol 4-phosphate cytidylyltransferase [Acutalibacteraceae bacterium]
MPKTEFAIEYSVKETENVGVPVIIVAAGSSSRMGNVNKMFSLLCGIPVVARTMLAFERNSYISEIIVVTKNESIADIQRIADNYMISKLTCITEGGSDRLSSVLCGLKCIKAAKGVLIHDGARPFVSQSLIEKMVKASETADCAVCAVKVKDTIKEDRDGFIKTADRNKLYAAQTPQAVNFGIYKELLENCEDRSRYTDDASVMEAAGYNTLIIEGEENNFKITTPYDLKIAQFILTEGKE